MAHTTFCTNCQGKPTAACWRLHNLAIETTCNHPAEVNCEDADYDDEHGYDL